MTCVMKKHMMEKVVPVELFTIPLLINDTGCYK